MLSACSGSPLAHWIRPWLPSFRPSLIRARSRPARLICERCHAGQMTEYEREVGRGGKKATIRGVRCALCGYAELADDEAIWSAVGL